MRTLRSTGFALGLLALACIVGLLATRSSAQVSQIAQVVVQSSLLAGLAPGAAFPFVNTRPGQVARAVHIMVTDATTSCAAKAAPPRSIEVRVGQTEGTLTNVMTAATNTGFSTRPGQCVFQVTVNPNGEGAPAIIRDVVVVNKGGAALTGINTITVSAELR